VGKKITTLVLVCGEMMHPTKAGGTEHSFSEDFCVSSAEQNNSNRNSYGTQINFLSGEENSANSRFHRKISCPTPKRSDMEHQITEKN
jgi:hypothetical protein